MPEIRPEPTPEREDIGEDDPLCAAYNAARADVEEAQRRHDALCPDHINVFNCEALPEHDALSAAVEACTAAFRALAQGVAPPQPRTDPTDYVSSSEMLGRLRRGDPIPTERDDAEFAAEAAAAEAARKKVWPHLSDEERKWRM
jgi:hypothetical protein